MTAPPFLCAPQRASAVQPAYRIEYKVMCIKGVDALSGAQDALLESKGY